MKVHHCIIPVLLISALIYTSCEPFEKVSDVPEIDYKGYLLYDSRDTLGNPIKLGELVFNFIDGDADIGTLTADDYNLFLIPYEKSGGLYDTVNANIYGRKYSIFYNEAMTRTGQNKTVKGEIKTQIEYHFDQPFDTLRYDFYILDRSGHKSNVESTRDIARWELEINRD
jgi:hypothetical protein